MPPTIAASTSSVRIVNVAGCRRRRGSGVRRRSGRRDARARDRGRRRVRADAGVGDCRGRHLGDDRGHGRGRERAAAPEPQEVGAQVVGALVAVLGILGERGHDDLLERRAGRSGLRCDGGTGSSRTCLYATLTGESAVNGATPVTIS